MAAAGPRARALAAAKADIITVAIGALAGRDEVARLVNEIRQTAADRTERIEFASPLFVVGDEAPPWVQRFLDADMAELTARDSLQILRGTPRQMADELQRRRDTVGTSYVSANAAFAEQLAPVVDMLAGR